MTTNDTRVDIKPRSRDVTDGFQKAASRAMLRAVGLTDDDWGKPQIGIASSWNEITPCNASLRRLTAAAKQGMRRAGGVPLEFGTITVSDGISMGNEGMRASLVSREIIADSVEAVMHAERFDGLVATGGCDKSMPGMMMAIARLNLPGVFVYNGSTLPGYLNGKALDITSVFEAIGACAAGTITEDELHTIEKNACPGEGACGGMFTANTMSSIGEALGLSLPGSASPPAVDRRRDDDATAAGEAVVEMLAARHRDRRDILTKQAFENVIALANALGGSTNAVLHLLAIANEAGVALELADFNRVAARVPHIADMKPGGKFHMTDLDRIGGVPVVLKHLLDAGLIHGDVLTVTGRTMAENLAAIDPPRPDGTVVHPLDAPINVEGGLNVLTGSLAPNGSVVKVAGYSGLGPERSNLVFPQFDGVPLLDSCAREQGAQGWEDAGIHPSSGVRSWTCSRPAARSGTSREIFRSASRRSMSGANSIGSTRVSSRVSRAASAPSSQPLAGGSPSWRPS